MYIHFRSGFLAFSAFTTRGPRIGCRLGPADGNDGGRLVQPRYDRPAYTNACFSEHWRTATTRKSQALAAQRVLQFIEVSMSPREPESLGPGLAIEACHKPGLNWGYLWCAGLKYGNEPKIEQESVWLT